MVLRYKDLCEIAQEYMYEAAYPENKGNIPAEVLTHIKSCSYCTKELAGITEFLADNAAFKTQRKAVSMARLGACAKEHFDFIGLVVDCMTTKEFLPLLADPGLQINIPTPITVHIDECPQCAINVSVLRSLNLKSRQLDTLADFYAESAFITHRGDNLFVAQSACDNAEISAELFAKMKFDLLHPKAIKDICLIADYHNLVYKKRSDMTLEIKDSAGPDNPLCKSIKAADLFAYCLLNYFDLADGWHKELDESVTNHLRQCKSCLRKLQFLHKAIFNIAEQNNSDIATCYELAPVIWDKNKPNAPVSCKTVRPHLPAFVNEPLGLIVPSALAAHLIDCPQCMNDFCHIDLLGLNTDQLERLREIFIGKAERTGISCKKAQAAIQAVGALKFSDIDTNVLEHLRLCPDCRSRLYKQRQTVLDEQTSEEAIEDGFDCGHIKTSDLFDYCFPIGECHPILTLHIAACRRCLTDMQKLHRTVCELTEKKETGILTENSVPVPPEKKTGLYPLDYQYPAWPIRVWINSEAEAGVQKACNTEYTDYISTKAISKTISLKDKLKQKIAGINLKRILMPAAAIIFTSLGLFLFLSTTAAKVVDLGQVYQAISRTGNISISSFGPDTIEPTRKKWVSKKLGIVLFQRGEKVVLWDIQNKVKKIKSSPSDVVEMIPLSEDMIAKAKRFNSDTFGVLPFKAITDIPKSAQWSRVYDKTLETIIQGTEVYDLTWFETKGNIIENHKLRLFIDIKTNLPIRAERYHTMTPEQAYILDNIKIVTYSTESEIDAVITNAFATAEKL